MVGQRRPAPRHVRARRCPASTGPGRGPRRGAVVRRRGGRRVLRQRRRRGQHLGHKAPGEPVVGSDERGWVAWVDPTAQGPELVVYERRRPASWPPRLDASAGDGSPTTAEPPDRARPGRRLLRRPARRLGVAAPGPAALPRSPASPCSTSAARSALSQRRPRRRLDAAAVLQTPSPAAGHGRPDLARRQLPPHPRRPAPGRARCVYDARSGDPLWQRARPGRRRRGRDARARRRRAYVVATGPTPVGLQDSGCRRPDPTVLTTCRSPTLRHRASPAPRCSRSSRPTATGRCCRSDRRATATDAHAPLQPGRRLLRRAAARQPGRGGARRRRRHRRARWRVRPLDQPLGDDLPAAARPTPGADYRLRIWTPGGELPFAGHPTLGSAHAWLEAGGVPRRADEVVQECGAGLVRIRRGERLSFGAPPLLRSGPVAEDDLTRIATALRVDRGDVVDPPGSTTGPAGWGCCCATPTRCWRSSPTGPRSATSRSAWSGATPPGAVAVEVRAFCPGYGMPEDPVTGSLNAGVGQWLAGARLPASYVAGQGTALRRGRPGARGAEGEEVWVGGDALTTVPGDVDLVAARVVRRAAVPRPPPAHPRRRRGEGRPHRHRHAQRLRPPDALRPGRGLPAGHHQEGPHPVGLRRAAVVPARRHQRQVAAGPRRHDLGRVGRRRTATSARSTATSGARGRRPTAGTSTRSRRSSTRSARDPDSRRHIVSRLERRRHPARWRWRRATRCSSSTSPTGRLSLPALPALAPTSSSACRSTSRPTPCSPTWSPR